MNLHKGHCRCGGVSVEVKGEPVVSVFCHCDDCRRSAGAPLIAAVGFENAYIDWTESSTLSKWQSGSCTRMFCNHCGSPVAQTHESADKRTFFYTAFMEDPTRFAPTYHSFAPEQLPWLELADSLPRYERTKTLNV